MTSSPTTDRWTAGWWATAALFALLAILVVMRALLVDQKIGSYIACPGCFHLRVFLEDLVAFSAFAGFLLLASCMQIRLLARVPLLFCGLILLTYVADLVVFKLYTSRLLMTDATLFLSEGGAIWDQFSSGLGGTAMGAGVIAAILALFALLLWMPVVRTARFRLTMTLVLATSLVASAYFKAEPYVNDWAVENVFIANMTTPSRNRYSSEIENRVLATTPPVASWSSNSTASATGRRVSTLAGRFTLTRAAAFR